MRFFFIGIAVILAIVIAHRVVVNMSPDHSREAGLKRVPQEDTSRQAQEDKSIWNTQRENRNQVPRH